MTFGLQPTHPQTMEWWGARAIPHKARYAEKVKIVGKGFNRRRITTKGRLECAAYLDFLPDRISANPLDGEEKLSPEFVKVLKGDIHKWLDKNATNYGAASCEIFPLPDGTVLSARFENKGGYVYCGVSRLPAPEVSDAQLSVSPKEISS